VTDPLSTSKLPHRVWIVEDSPLEAKLAAGVLAPEFQIAVFPDGASVIEELSTTRELPDVILADWVLPGIDGLELCRVVRQSFDEIALPVIIVTAREGRDVRLQALDARVNDVVMKPFDPQELRARVRVHARVRRLHHPARELEGALEMFVGTVSHDLRTPLHAISGYAQLMASRDDLPEKHRHWAERITAVGGRMARMLDELVEITQLRGGNGITLERRVTQLNDVVAMVVEEVQLAHPGVVIAATYDGENAGLWDADRLARVVQNLLTNAIVHGSTDTPARVQVREGDDDTTTIVVRNGGKPVPENLRASLFDPFRRARKSGTGMGLGLYITRQLVKAHGGEVTFTSSVEDGTTFTVSLPRSVAPAPRSDARSIA
jgi:signal transduction histidine kinase